MFGGKHKDRDKEIIEVAEFIGIKSFKAKGKRLTNYSVNNITEIEPVLKKESEKVADPADEFEETTEDKQKPPTDGDPAQMSLFGE